MKAGERVEMPVFFYLDPAYALDPDMEEVRTIELSYTFVDTDTAKDLIEKGVLDDPNSYGNKKNKHAYL